MGIAAALALSGLLAAQAHGGTRIETTSDRPFQRWVDRARVPTPDAVITVIEGRCPFARAAGCTYEGSLTIWVDRDAGRSVFLHELGHQFDYLELDDAERNRFRRLVGEEREWRSPPNSPHENFAEAYSLCARKRRLTRAPWLWLTDFRPIVRKFRGVCGRIRRSYSSSAAPAASDPAEGNEAVVTVSAVSGSPSIDQATAWVPR